MAKLALNKGSLHRETRRLKAFRQFVPALDLKRKQILAARRTSRNLQVQLSRQRDELLAQVRDQVPMLAASDLPLSRLVRIRRADIDSVNLVGIDLPRLRDVEFDRHQHSRLVMPAWVDTLVDLVVRRLEVELALKVERTRLERLEAALRKTSQRLNLFDKVLIPRSLENIRRIRIALSDGERAAVVRAKIAKAKGNTMRELSL